MDVINKRNSIYTIKANIEVILILSHAYYFKTVSYLLDHSVNHVGYIEIPSMTKLNELAVLVLLEDPKLCKGLMEFMILIKALNRPNEKLTLHLRYQ